MPDGAHLMCDASVWEESWETKVLVKMEGGVGEDETMTSGACSPVFQDSAAAWNSVCTRAQPQAAPRYRHLVAEGALQGRTESK